jgi:hypothetical protein
MEDLDAAERAVADRLSLLWHFGIKSHAVTMILELMAIEKPEDVTPTHRRNAERIWSDLQLKLSLTELMIAPSEICNMLNIAGPSYPAEELFLSDILVPYGMVWFADTIDDPDKSQSYYPVRALSWTMDMPGDSVIPKLWHPRENPLLTIIGYADTSYMARVSEPNTLVSLTPKNYPTIYPIFSVVWEIDANTGSLMVNWDDPEQVATIRLPFVKVLMAFWAVLRQRLVIDEEPTVKISPRQVKYAKRKNPNLNTTVKLIKMKPKKRTVYTGFHGFNRPKWSVQWVVRPHWRRQWHPKTEEHKWVLIWNYVKGPDDAPMVGVERAFLPPPPMPEEEA